MNCLGNGAHLPTHGRIRLGYPRDMIVRVICLLMLVWSSSVAALVRQPLAEPRFQHIGDTTSISDGVVTALAQDEAGLIWVGTTIGLVRHDGYQLKPFHVGEGSGQFTGTSFVRSLLAAPGRKLWVGLEKDGLALLDTARNTWTVYRADPARPRALSAGSVRALARDLDGRLWVGTMGGGLDGLDPDLAGFTHHRRATGHLPGRPGPGPVGRPPGRPLGGHLEWPGSSQTRGGAVRAGGPPDRRHG